MHAYMCEKQEPYKLISLHTDHTNLSGGLHMKQTHFLPALLGPLAARFADAFGVAFTFDLALALAIPREAGFGMKGL